MLAIVAAVKEEIKDYVRRGKFQVEARDGPRRFYLSPSHPEVVVVEGGVGRSKAQEATRQLIDRYEPDFIVSAGFAGGVQPGFSPGDLVVCDRFLCLEGSPSTWTAGAANERATNDLAATNGVLDRSELEEEYQFRGCLSVPAIVSSSSTKEWIGVTFPVSVVDMESYWVNETAAEHGIAHVGVRAVLDPMEQSLPAFVASSMNDTGARRVVRAISTLASRPWEAPSLFGLAMKVSVASGSLGSFLIALKPGQVNA